MLLRASCSLLLLLPLLLLLFAVMASTADAARPVRAPKKKSNSTSSAKTTIAPTTTPLPTTEAIKNSSPNVLSDDITDRNGSDSEALPFLTEYLVTDITTMSESRTEASSQFPSTTVAKKRIRGTSRTNSSQSTTRRPGATSTPMTTNGSFETSTLSGKSTARSTQAAAPRRTVQTRTATTQATVLAGVQYVDELELNSTTVALSDAPLEANSSHTPAEPANSTLNSAVEEAECIFSQNLKCSTGEPVICRGYGLIDCMDDQAANTPRDAPSALALVGGCIFAPTLKCTPNAKQCTGKALCEPPRNASHEAGSPDDGHHEVASDQKLIPLESHEDKDQVGDDRLGNHDQMVGPLGYWEVAIISGFTAFGGFILIGVCTTIYVSYSKTKVRPEPTTSLRGSSENHLRP